jgi:monofunctional biosynthetic peptidoglycan transglycosylase
MLNKVTSWFKTYYKDVAVVLITFSVAWVQIYRFLNPPTTLTMLTRMTIDGGSLEYHFVNTNQISPFIKVCAMASEDQNLPFHSGIDFEAIQKAIHVNKKGKKVFGASTITQQVAKNVFLFPQRSYIRKALELYFTLWIETLWSKDKILEMYLNVAEMGTLVFGVEAAAQKYYSKPATKLNLRESASIIAILPNPRNYKIKNPGSYVASRQSEIQSLFRSLDGNFYLRELYVKSENSLYDFSKYKKNRNVRE